MGHALPRRSIAVVVENDHEERSLLAALLEEMTFEVVECESAEAALAVMQIKGDRVAMLFTDVQLAGNMDGVELAQIFSSHRPRVSVIVTSGKLPDRVSDLPADAVYLPKPWYALDVFMAAEHAHLSPR